ncbi:uncharacterized protein LOC109827121 [Asparagus officinalis]|uniref:uncharacterized protein LOC109827121 n=1 Tax=Asparagus officinalis TaxID=4686 RepID=UPI00098E26D6|nr:uncharacterized protein LOC109827121 [Asparagus officinalis]
METYVKKVWANSANPDVFLLKPRIFLFKFKNKDEMSDILEKGPWFFGSRPLSLKPWSIGEDYEKINSSLYPVWIQLPALKLNLWNVKSISKIASAVGRPITTDKLTANKQRLAYARVLVEMDMPASLPDFITLKGPDGKLFNQKILYELKPRWCNHCKSVGHDTLFCKRTIGVQRWVPKTINSTAQNTQKASVQDPGFKENFPNIQTTSSIDLPNNSVHNMVLQRTDGNVSTMNTEMQERIQKQMKEKELSPMNYQHDEQAVQISRIENIPQSGLRGVHSLVYGARAQQTGSESSFHSPQSNNSWSLVQGNKQRKKFTPENQFFQLEYFDLDPSTVDRGGAFN